jgi:hypothetical protein
MNGVEPNAHDEAPELIGPSRLQHGDETGIRVYGMLHWLHVNCTRAPFPSGVACLVRPSGHGREQLSFDDAQARTPHALCSDGCLP